MQTINQIINTSLKSTRSNPRWWIFAFIQIISLVGISSLNKPKVLLGPGLFWLLAFILILQPSTVGLWLEIESTGLRQVKTLTTNIFLQKCLSCLALTLFSAGLIIFVRLVYPSWIFLAILSSFVAATSALAALYIVLFGQTFFSAWGLAFDTWHKKISLAAAAALVIIVGHALAFAFVHEVSDNLLIKSQSFASFHHSATIWMLLVLTGFILAFCAAFANCFLVLLFLDIINRKKDPEAEKEKIPNLEPVKSGI
jgi:hypothetical protein